MAQQEVRQQEGRVNLWKHQKAALRALRAELRKADRTQLHTVPGGGKTTTFIRLASDYERIVICVPSRALIRKTLKDLHRVWPESQRIPTLAVCTRGTTSLEEDSFALPCFEGADADLVRAHMEGDGKRIVLSTYRSSPHVREANVRFDLGIFDEAHHTATAYDNGEKRMSVALLDDGKTRIAKRVFVTATPRVYSAKIRAGVGHVVTSMDDPGTFGSVAFDFGYRAALDGAENVVKPFLVHVAQWTKDPDDEWVNARHMQAIAALEKVRENHDASHALAFCNNILNSKRVQAIYSQRNPQDFSMHVDAYEFTPLERDYVLDDFKLFDRGLISNVNCFTEGVDAPCVDCVIFADPAHSEVAISQAVGRALRFDPEKPDAYAHVIVPLVHDDEGQHTARAMRHVMDVLGAIGALDKSFESEVRELSRRSARETTSRINLLPGDLPEFELRDVMRRIAVLTYSGGDFDWWKRYEELARYVEEHGRWPAVTGSSLGRWLNTQKQIHRGGMPSCRRLSTDQEAALEGLPGFMWRKTRRYTDKVCDLCGQQFHPKKMAARYCSKECQNAAFRKTHCLRGHERTPDNLTPKSACRVCNREAQRARYAARNGMAK